MLARIASLALVGLGAQQITVGVDLASGLPGFQIADLPEKVVDEVCERIDTAIRNAGFEFLNYRSLELAHTIADLGAVDQAELPHLVEALQYRRMDSLWSG